MPTYRPTTLKLASRHCPRALDYYEEGRPHDRSQYAVGIAAHAVLEALGRAGGEHAQAVADGVLYALTTAGRTFDNHAEPPLPLDEAIEGRDLALRYAAGHTFDPQARYELGVGFDRDWRPVGYSSGEARSGEARFRLIFDVLEVATEEDEEQAGEGVVVLDYKTAWSTSAAELDTMQMRAQAVCAMLLPSERENAFVRQEVVNLRTEQTFSRTIWSDAEGLALLDRWRRDLDLAMNALDEMPRPRPARPGAGCLGCPWVSSCEPAREYLEQVRLPDSPEALARAYATAEAMRDEFREAAQAALDELGAVEVDGARVGTVGLPRREPKEDAALLLLERWQQAGGEVRGLLKAMAPGKAALDAAARALYPKDKTAREALIEELTVPVTVKRFGIHREET